MTNDEYHANTSRISKSGLDLINRSPLHYYANYLDPNRPPRKTTDAFTLGSLFHKLTLEPDTFANEYMVLPPNAPSYPTAAQWNAKNPSLESVKAMEFWRGIESTYKGVTIIDREQMDIASRMRDSVMNNASAAHLLSSGRAERSVMFTEPDTGAPCKCRPDWETSSDIIVDLKSTIDASPDEFGRSAYNYRYRVQAAFYIDGLNIDAGFEKIKHFVFIAIEKTPPYGVAVYFIDQEAIDLGRRDYLRNCATYVECLKNGTWPGYSNEVQGLRIPTYAYRK